MNENQHSENNELEVIPSSALEQMERAAGIVDHEADDTVVHGVAGGDGEDVDFGFCEGIDDSREGAGTIIEKNGELFRNLHHKRSWTTGRIARIVGFASELYRRFE